MRERNDFSSATENFVPSARALLESGEKKERRGEEVEGRGERERERRVGRRGMAAVGLTNGVVRGQVGETEGRFSCMRVVLIFIILFCFRS